MWRRGECCVHSVVLLLLAALGVADAQRYAVKVFEVGPEVHWEPVLDEHTRFPVCVRKAWRESQIKSRVSKKHKGFTYLVGEVGQEIKVEPDAVKTLLLTKLPEGRQWIALDEGGDIVSGKFVRETYSEDDPLLTKMLKTHSFLTFGRGVTVEHDKNYTTFQWEKKKKGQGQDQDQDKRKFRINFGRATLLPDEDVNTFLPEADGSLTKIYLEGVAGNPTVEDDEAPPLPRMVETGYWLVASAKQDAQISSEANPAELTDQSAARPKKKTDRFSHKLGIWTGPPVARDAVVCKIRGRPVHTQIEVVGIELGMFTKCKAWAKGPFNIASPVRYVNSKLVSEDSVDDKLKFALVKIVGGDKPFIGQPPTKKAEVMDDVRKLVLGTGRLRKAFKLDKHSDLLDLTYKQKEVIHVFQRADRADAAP